MGENACDDVFDWAARDPRRVTFARKAGSEDLAHFLNGAGFTLMEGWGLTETTGPVTMNPPGAQRIGSVGLPVPGCAVRAVADGEIEVQGPNVFDGYWRYPTPRRSSGSGSSTPRSPSAPN